MTFMSWALAYVREPHDAVAWVLRVHFVNKGMNFMVSRARSANSTHAAVALTSRRDAYKALTSCHPLALTHSAQWSKSLAGASTR